MFQAFDQHQQRSLVAIDPEWQDQSALGWLRQRCRWGTVTCPWCHAPVLIRAGTIVVRHFAHKRLQECPYANEGAERLLGRKILYEWLVGKLGKSVVQLEPRLDDVSLPLPLDVLVALDDRRYGYWFVSRTPRRLCDRDDLLTAIEEGKGRGLHLHLVFSAKSFKPVGNPPDLARLSAALRELSRASEYDGPGRGRGSLQFLDVDSGALTTLRGLSVFEWPQTFSFRWIGQHPVLDLLIRPSNGEIVHPGEHEAMSEAETRRRQRAVWQQEPAAGRLLNRASEYTPRVPVDPPPGPTLSEQPERLARCETCGRLTPEENQIIYDGRTKTCKCRTCVSGVKREV